MSKKDQLHATEAQWTAYNPVLRRGALAISYDAPEVRVGDGVSNWADLDAVGGGGGGVSLPTGGTTGQMLAKASDTDGDAEWVDAAAGGGSESTTEFALDAVNNKGLFWDLGTEGNTVGYASPDGTYVTHTASSNGTPAAIAPVLDRDDTTEWNTSNVANSWLKVFIDTDAVGRKLAPTYIRFQQRHSSAGNMAVTLKFEGSNDDSAWTTLATGLAPAAGIDVWSSLDVSHVDGLFYSYFRLTMTAPDSSGFHYLVVGAWELFGTVDVPVAAGGGGGTTVIIEGTFTASTGITFEDCFSADYDTYILEYDITDTSVGAGGSMTYFRFANGGVADASNEYNWGSLRLVSTTETGNTTSYDPYTYCQITTHHETDGLATASVMFRNPFGTDYRASWRSESYSLMATPGVDYTIGLMETTASYDGFHFGVASGDTADGHYRLLGIV